MLLCGISILLVQDVKSSPRETDIAVSSRVSWVSELMPEVHLLLTNNTDKDIPFEVRFWDKSGGISGRCEKDYQNIRSRG